MRYKIFAPLILLPIFGCPLDIKEPCDYSEDEIGETGSSPENPQTCEISQEIFVNGGYVKCGNQLYDETLEHMEDEKAVSFGMPDYAPDDENGYSYVAIVDGREPGPVSAKDYRAFVEAVVEYQDPYLGLRMGLMGRVCCPNEGWWTVEEKFPETFGSKASPQCQDPFGTGDIYPEAYCLPMPDAPWPSDNVPEGYSTPPTGGLCVFFCNYDWECPGYGLGLQFCQLPYFESEEGSQLIETNYSDQLPYGVCRNVNYPALPTTLVEEQPLHRHLVKDISL